MGYSKAETQPCWYFSDVITITSETGVGGTSTLEALRRKFSRDQRKRFISGGEIFRRFAKKEGKTIERFVEHCKNKSLSEHYDKLCDRRLAEFGLKNHTVLESRLVHAFVPHGFHVLLTCDLRRRALRRQGDSGYRHFSVEEVMRMIKQRDEDDKIRFQSLYPGCLWKPHHFDLRLNTEILPPETLANRIILGHQRWREEKERKKELRYWGA